MSVLISFLRHVLGKPLHISEGNESFPFYLPPTEDRCLPFGRISPFSVLVQLPLHSPPPPLRVPHSVLFLASLG